MLDFSICTFRKSASVIRGLGSATIPVIDETA